MLGLLRVENIFDFSQTTFNLALTIFSRLIVSVKVGKSMRDGDRCWGCKLTSISHCCLRGEPSQVLRLSLINSVNGSKW